MYILIAVACPFPNPQLQSEFGRINTESGLLEDARMETDQLQQEIIEKSDRFVLKHQNTVEMTKEGFQAALIELGGLMESVKKVGASQQRETAHALNLGGVFTNVMGLAGTIPFKKLKKVSEEDRRRQIKCIICNKLFDEVTGCVSHMIKDHHDDIKKNVSITCKMFMFIRFCCNSTKNFVKVFF